MNFGRFVPDWPAPQGVRALVTTRAGGCSRAPYDSFNLGDHVGDDPAAVAAHRASLEAACGARIAWLQQVHGVACVPADGVLAAAISGVGVAQALPAPLVADASWTRTRRHACAIMTADCLPVLFCDDQGAVVAAAHAGWRGLAAGVLENTIAAMGVAPSRLLVWLGPAIGPAAYEVGTEVRDVFCDSDSAATAAFAPGSGNKWLCDLYALARLRLRNSGVARISGGDRCTHGEKAHFYSHRREGVTGRMAALIWLV